MHLSVDVVPRSGARLKALQRQYGAHRWTLSSTTRERLCLARAMMRDLGLSCVNVDSVLDLASSALVARLAAQLRRRGINPASIVPSADLRRWVKPAGTADKAAAKSNLGKRARAKAVGSAGGLSDLDR